ncbi:unnamed protein product, partial [marine sediment metagenome]
QALDGIGVKVTASNLDTLTDGSNADLLHTHLGISSFHNLLDGLNTGDYIHLTSAEKTNFDTNIHAEIHTIFSHDTAATGSQLTNLTNATNADALHIHGASGITGLTPTEILFGSGSNTIGQSSSLTWDGSKLDINGNLDLNGYLDFDINISGGAEPEGRVWWNKIDRTLNMATGLGPVLQTGQELFIIVYNDTGETIPNGTAVYPVGGFDGRPSVAPAMANTHVMIAGDVLITTMDILDQNEGIGTKFGKIRGI